MIEILALFFIFIAALELWIGYKVISRSDPFTFISLISIRFIFFSLKLPFTFTFIETYQPGIQGINRSLIHSSAAPLYSLMTMILNDLSFCLL